tara:strand:- start:3544 stop:5991 length:2448 start_codon:yes stop_codon:yes gene_type:complete
MEVVINRGLKDRLFPKEMQASRLVPILAYDPDNGIYLNDDQTLGFAFLCEPLNYGDEKIQDRVTELFNQLFPEETTLQFILFRSPDVEAKLASMMALRDGFRHSLLTNVVRERIKYLRHYTNEKLVTKNKKGVYDNGLVQDLKLIITVKIPITNPQPSKSEMEKVSDLREKVDSSLRAIGLQPRKMDADMLIRTMSTMLNWGPNASWREGGTPWEHDKTIADQVFDYGSEIRLDKNSMMLGDQHVRVLSAKKLPPAFFFSSAMAYVGDISGGSSSVRENYMIVVNIFYPPNQKTKDRLETKRKITVNQAYGPMLKMVPVLAEKKGDFDVMYDAIGDGASIVQVSYSAIIFAPTRERVQSAATSMASFWKESRFTILEDNFVSLPIFLNGLPLCTDRKAVKHLKRYKTMTSKQAAVLVPIFGEWKGTGTFHSALLSRNGQLMSASLHDSDTNKNLVIAAESGSGKSFWANELLLSYMSEGAQVWVIDAGKSYQNLNEVLEGDFLQFNDSTNICLNPFPLVRDYADEEDALVSLVATMASEKGLLTELQKSHLKRIMSELWDEHAQGLKVDHIAAACLASEDQRVRDIGSQLYMFTSKGNYGKYFAYDNNVRFANPFTVLELDELQGRKHLRQVVLLQLIYQIQQEVFLGEPNRKKICFIDEAWDLLKEGEVATFIEHAYRKFRKYGGSVIIATQSINDLYENTVGRAIAENSSSMHLLGQTAETVESVRESKRLSLSEGGFNLLRSVHTVAGVYSEIFIKSKNGTGVGRLIVGEYPKLMYSTDPVDRNDINRYKNKGMNVNNAIIQVLKDRGLYDA